MVTKLCLIFLILSTVLTEASAQSPYNKAGPGFILSGTETIIEPATPIKSQDGIGLCYAFSATSLLESYRCRELNLNCNDPHEFLSTLDVTSNYENERLKEGGSTFRILSNLESGRKKIAREECIQFATLVHQMADNKNNMIKDEKRGWIFLTKKWNEYKGLGDTKRNDCVSCLANSIKSTLVNIQTPSDQIKNAFLDAHTLEEFLYKTLLPSQCLLDSKMAAIPPFTAKIFPGYNEVATDRALTNKIEILLKNKIPLEMGICTDPNRPCRENFGHSIALYGFKEVRSPNTGEIKKLVKVKNSYGMSWQKENNDGWVELSTLVEASLAQSQHENISWIQKPGFVPDEKVIAAASATTVPPARFIPARQGNSEVPAAYKNYHGIWKCNNSSFIDHYEPNCVPAVK
jgi:hypothetical protein